jgi:small-conductance mechanosensitive channel
VSTRPSRPRGRAQRLQRIDTSRPDRVAYAIDLDHATKVLLEVAAAEPKAQTEPAPDVRHDGFADSAITLALVVWIREAKEEALVSSKLRFAIARAFRANHIVIPVPQRELHVHQA